MKSTLTQWNKVLPVRIYLFLTIVLINSASALSQSITVTNETLPNTYNTSFGSTNNTNGSFTGSTGTWTCSFNGTNGTQLAAIAVIPAYYSAVTNAIKIVNWNTSGKGAANCHAVSPTVNLSSYDCSPDLSLSFKLYTYTTSANDPNSFFKVEFSNDNGANWTAFHSWSSQYIANNYPQNGLTTVTVAIPAAYRVSGFKYRFSGYKPANQGNNFYLFVDDAKITAETCSTNCTAGGINFGNLVSNYFMVFTNGSTDANWQSASKGFIGNVAVDGIQASERTSGSFAYAGTIYTNASSLGNWQSIVDNNSSQAFASVNQTSRLSGLETDLESVFSQINALPVSSGYSSVASTSLNGLNTQNSIAETFVINVTSGFSISSKINITGDAGDIFILRWDTDANFSDGYEGQVKFQSGGAIVPLGGLKPSNFIHVAGDINASGGGSNPTAPYPQGPRTNNGTGLLISGGSDFNGGGFFTGYWFTTGSPTITGSGQPYGETASLSNAIFVGGWYSKTTKFSMTSGTSGVYVEPVCTTAACTGRVTSLYFNELNGGADLPITNGSTFDINTIGSLYNLEAGTTGTVGSVKFTITGPTPSSNTENAVPYNSPATGSGPWTGALGSYSVNLKTYSGSNASGTLCHDTTITFNLVDNTCSCPGNIVLNPSFENGTTNWTSSGGNFNATTGAVKCGSKSGDFQITNNSNNSVRQTIGTDLPVGTIVNASVYAGTHDNTFYHQVSIDFFDQNWTLISSSSVEVNKVLAASPVGPQLYTWSGTVPVGAKYTNVSFSGNGNWIKTDQWCVTITTPTVGSIGDRIWNDLNKDGVQDANEVGLAGVTVTLFDNGNNVVATTVTDAFGNYLFSNLPTSAGGTVYQVRYSLLPGYQFSPNNGAITVTNNSDANPATGRTGNITLTNATPNVTYVDAGMYYTAPARLGDFVWNDVNNNGIQDAGEPGIAGVTVMLYTSADVLYRSTVTSNNGYYFFNEVAPGTYYVKVTPPIGYKASPKDATSDGADSDIDPVTFKTGNYTVVNGTNNLTIDAGFNVTPTTGASASLGDKVWEDLNNNNVQDAGEPGIPNVTVELYNSANVLQASTTTDAFGNYIFNGLTPGDYYVKFTLPSGFSYVTPYTGSDETKDSDVDGSNGAGTTGLVTVVADEINTTIDAGMRRTTAGANLGDFVWYDLNKNGVQDGGSEVGVPGITVILYNSANAVVKTTTTDINGFYLFTGLTASTAYTVGFENIPAGYGFSPNVGAVTVTNNSDVNPATGRTGTVTTGATGTTVSYIDAGLIITPNRFDSKSSIGDRVWNDLNNNGIQDNGEPRISGVTVTLYAFDGTTVVATTTTDALGNYLFTNLNAGTYVVGFTGLPAGYVFATKDAGSDDTKDSDVNSGTGKTDPFVIGAGEINLTIDAGARNTNTALSSIGNFVWYDVNGNGIQNSGEPGAAGISVSLLNSAGTVLKTTITSAGGEYLFTDLAAGTYFVQFGNLPAGYTATTKNAAGSTAANNSDANTATLTTDAIVLPASTVDLNWDMGIVSATRASLGDFVWNDLDGDGRQDAGEPGVAGVTVTLYNSSNVAVAQTVTDANGFYFFSNVLPGTYSVGFSTIPAASTFTVQNAAIATAATNSDVDPATGRTATFTLVGGQSKTDVDAGLISYKASVGDYVWNDINKDGIQDAGEVGVAGVTVTMYSSTNATIGDGDDVAVASAVTDANGYYFINDVTVAQGGSQFYMRYTDVPTKYTSFTLPLVGGNGAANNSKVEDQDLSNGRTGFFSLSPNQIYRSMDAGIYKSINLSGHVWHDANGMADNLVNNSGALQTPPASQIPNLYAYLVNANTGLVEQVVDVDPFTNQYSFTNLTPNTNYQVIVTTAFQVIGGVAPPSLLPTSWLHTGQQLGLTPGNDGLNDGILEISVGEEDIIDANFGIRKRGNDIVTG